MNKNAIFVSWVTHPLPTKLMLVLLLFSVTLQAQNNSIKGTVSDNIGTMPGVNVIIKGTNIGTLTDSDGNFQITAKTNDTLMFSYLGYISDKSNYYRKLKKKIIKSENYNEFLNMRNK